MYLTYEWTNKNKKEWYPAEAVSPRNVLQTYLGGQRIITIRNICIDNEPKTDEELKLILLLITE